MSKINEPLPGSGNALDPPGYGAGQNPVEIVQVTGPTYAPGQWVETSVPSAALYGRFPKETDQPIDTLPTGTPLKVVSMQGTYAKVELESGQIGFVPAIMVAEKRSSSEIPIVPTAPTDVLPGSGLAPEPEVAPISVEDATNGPPVIDRIDPASDTIE